MYIQIYTLYTYSSPNRNMLESNLHTIHGLQASKVPDSLDHPQMTGVLLTISLSVSITRFEKQEPPRVPGLG